MCSLPPLPPGVSSEDGVLYGGEERNEAVEAEEEVEEVEGENFRVSEDEYDEDDDKEEG